MKKYLFGIFIFICFFILNSNSSFAYSVTFTNNYSNGQSLSFEIVSVPDNMPITDLDNIYIRVHSSNELYKYYTVYFWTGTTWSTNVRFHQIAPSKIINNTLTVPLDTITSFECEYGEDVPTLPPTPSLTIDNGLGYDIALSHTEIKYPFLSTYWEFVSVKGAWNYPTVRELSFDIYVNGVKRDTINKLNNFGTNFGVAFDFFTSYYNVVEGDTIRILCTPLGNGVRGLARGVEWVVGSKENINISKIPNVTPKIEINNESYTPSIQEERQFVYNPITNDYVTNNYYTQNYESPDLDNIESQLDYIIQYIIDNPISSGASEPQTIINYNTTNKNYNLNFGDFNFGDIDVDLEIGNAKEHVKQSFDDFITNIQLLMNSPFEKIVVAFGVGIGLVLLVLAIVIVAKILNIIIP